MKIGLFDIDSKYHNLALMKLSTYHKQKGHEVELYKPLWKDTYQIVFASKIFSKKNKNEMYLPEGCIKGGSGFSLKVRLSEGTEHLMPDYFLYNLNYSLGFTTRGCIRDCGFCIVRQKEGYIREHAKVEEFLNPKSNIVVLLDNNFLALPSHIKKLQKYIDKGWRMDFNQGLDIRLINEDNAKLLAKITYYKQLRFSWDFLNIERSVKEGLKLLFKEEIKPCQIMVFMLCNYNTSFEEDMYRYNELDALGVVPFVMNYGKPNHKLRHFARWVNKRWLCQSATWEEYYRGVR